MLYNKFFSGQPVCLLMLTVVFESKLLIAGDCSEAKECPITLN